MAGVAKRLRPRIVVPICVGSNPITRPIKKRPHLRGLFYCKIKGFQSSSKPKIASFVHI